MFSKKIVDDFVNIYASFAINTVCIKQVNFQVYLYGFTLIHKFYLNYVASMIQPFLFQYILLLDATFNHTRLGQIFIYLYVGLKLTNVPTWRLQFPAPIKIHCYINYVVQCVCNHSYREWPHSFHIIYTRLRYEFIRGTI